MNKITKLTYTALLCFLFFTIHAQEKHCGTTEMQKRAFEADPQLYQEYIKENARLEAIDKQAFANGYKETDRSAAPPVYIIPVVFHVLHQNGPENISDDQIKSAVAVLNQDFRKLNSDTGSIIPLFKSIAADAEIEFRLAQKTPTGACTNGINRVLTAETFVGDNGSKSGIYWRRDWYMNVWVVSAISSGAAGYAYYPGGAPSASVDGIMILSTYVGNTGTGSAYRSRTLTHEVGHFLNLRHVWGDGNEPGCDGTGSGSPCFGADNCNIDDGVTDTPNTRGWTTCNLSGKTCTSDPSQYDNVQNYMDYSYCFSMFTAGQKTRMRSALTSANGQRNTLWTTTNLTTNTGVSSAAVLCKADFDASFLANSSNTICQGNSLTFTDKSWNGTPTGWTWSFPGGTPSTSTSASPVIQYNTAGTYNVSLTVTNSSGTVSATKTAYVIVNPTVATYTNATYTESFEGSAIPNADWKVRNMLPGGNTWVQTTAAGATGTKSVRIVNAPTYDTYVDELVSPPINMTAITGTGVTLTFKVAHAQKTATSADKLQLYVSTNCGQTWTIRKTITGAALSTAGVSSTWTTPTSTQWGLQSSSLTSFTGQTNFYIMFRFTSNAGSNIYLDDINISGTVGVEDEFSDALSFNIYPNPAEDNSVVGFNLLDKQKVELSVYDVLGQHVSTIVEGNLNAGEHEYKIADKTSLSSGIYFVKLVAGDQKFTKKLIVR
ncbi:MAG: M43 family zinc metalloprotease [Bacteroidota bacterium]